MTTVDFLDCEYASPWQWRIDTDPELAAATGMLSGRRLTHAIDPRSLTSVEQRLDWVQSALDRVKDVSLQDLSPSQRLTYKLYIDQLTDYVTYTKVHKTYLCCINRLEGPQTDLSLYASYLPTKTRKKQEFFLAFVKAIPQQLREIQQLLSQGMEEGRTPPSVGLGGVVEQMQSMVEIAISETTCIGQRGR